MELVQFFPNVIPWLADLGAGHSIDQNVLWQISGDWSLLAQQFDQDVFAGFRDAFSNFIESGQVWALLIGVIIGYFLKSVFTY